MMWCPGLLLPALCIGHLFFQQQQKPPSVLCLNCNHLSLGESSASSCSQSGMEGSREGGTFLPTCMCQGVAGFTPPMSVGNGGRWKLNIEIILELVVEVWQSQEL